MVQWLMVWEVHLEEVWDGKEWEEEKEKAKDR